MTCPTCKSENQNGKFCTSCGYAILDRATTSSTLKLNPVKNYLVIGIVVAVGLSLIGALVKSKQPNSAVATVSTSSEKSKIDVASLTKNTESVKINFVKYLKYKISGSSSRYSLNAFTCAGLMMENGRISTAQHCTQNADANLKDKEIELTANLSGERIEQVLNDKYSISPKYLSQDFVFPYKSAELIDAKKDPLNIYYVFTSDKIVEVKATCVDTNCSLVMSDECKSEKCEMRQGQSGSPVFNSFGQYVGNLSYVINPTTCINSDNYDYKIYLEEKEINVSDFESSSKSYYDTVKCSNKFAFSALTTPVNYSAAKPRENDDKKYVEVFENFDNDLEYLNLRAEPCGAIVGKINFGETGYSSGEVVDKECYGKNIKFQKITLDSGAIGFMAKENMRTVKNTASSNTKYDIKNECYQFDDYTTNKCKEYNVTLLANSKIQNLTRNSKEFAVEGKEIGNRKYFVVFRDGFDTVLRGGTLFQEIWFYDKNKESFEKFSQDTVNFDANCDYQEGKSAAEACKEGFVLNEKNKEILEKIKTKIELYSEKNKFSSQLAYQQRNDRWKWFEKVIYNSKILDTPEKYIPIQIDINVKSFENAPAKLTLFVKNPKPDIKTKSIEVKIDDQLYGSLKNSESLEIDLSGLKGMKTIEVVVNNSEYQAEKFTISNVIFGK